MIFSFRVSLKTSMTSPSPLLYDTYYHIYNRGVNRENIFVEERNYELFLRLFEKHLHPVADLFAYCLLRNHFHISVRIKSEEEIIKTLRVSPIGNHHGRQGHTTDHQHGQSRKPLGSRYVSDQFSNFFNAYAKRFALTKPTGGPVVYSSIHLDAYPLPQIDNFGM
jgi:REP-associated tyrosine transposase